VTRDVEPELRCLDDAEALCSAAADEFIRCGNRAIEARGSFRVALSGGSTPRRLYSLLCTLPQRDQLAWPAVEFYFGDERAVAPEHSDSNYRMARENLFEPLEIDASQIYRMPAEQPNLEAAAADYEQLIANRFGVSGEGSLPRFDLILLGMGTDGHTASLFPGTDALQESSRWVVSNQVPQLDTSRMTFTYPLINAADRVLLLVAGREKAEVLARVLEGPENEAALPAQGVRPDPGSLLVLIDREAGETLNPSLLPNPLPA
jgi:6-phosphogluconolactonase